MTKPADSASRRLAQPSRIEPLEPRQYFSVDLTAAVTLSAPGSGVIKTGGDVIFSVVVTNDGTTSATGKLLMDLGLSASSSGSSPTSLKARSKKINLAAGASATLTFAEKVPDTLTAPASYYGVADVDPNNTFNESDTSNNTAVSSAAVSVQGKFPDVEGTWTITGTIKKGPGKGSTFSSGADVTSENMTTGVYTFSGTEMVGGISYAYTGSGKIQPNGAFSSVQTYNTGTKLHAKGKINGDALTEKWHEKGYSGTAIGTLS